MSKEKDMSDFKNLLRKLELKGKRHDKGDVLTESLGGEEFTYATRSIVSEMVNIIEDNPEFTNMVPEKLREFFEGYKIDWKKHISGGSMNKVAVELLKIAKSLIAEKKDISRSELARMLGGRRFKVKKVSFRGLGYGEAFDLTVDGIPKGGMSTAMWEANKDILLLLKDIRESYTLGGLPIL